MYYNFKNMKYIETLANCLHLLAKFHWPTKILLIRLISSYLPGHKYAQAEYFFRDKHFFYLGGVEMGFPTIPGISLHYYKIA